CSVVKNFNSSQSGPQTSQPFDEEKLKNHEYSIRQHKHSKSFSTAFIADFTNFRRIQTVSLEFLLLNFSIVFYSVHHIAEQDEMFQKIGQKFCLGNFTE